MRLNWGVLQNRERLAVEEDPESLVRATTGGKSTGSNSNFIEQFEWKND